MNYHNFNGNQKRLTDSVTWRVEHSGCNIEEIAEVLSEVLGSILAYRTPSKAELADYLDSKIIPNLRTVALDFFDSKDIAEKMKGK